MGHLVGVLYKPIDDGKDSNRLGIEALVKDTPLEVAYERGIVYRTNSGKKGLFRISVPPGKYKIFVGDDEKGIPVTIEKGKTIIKNIQREQYDDRPLSKHGTRMKPSGQLEKEASGVEQD